MEVVMSQENNASLSLAQSLNALRAECIGHVIGKEVITESETHSEVLNPATGEVVCSVPEGTARTVDLAVVAAREAFPGWRALTPLERYEILYRVADVIDEHSETLARLEALQTGKPIEVARAEMPLAADTFRFMAGAARTAQAPASGEYASGQFSMIVREPIGVVAGVAPWNYPLMMAAWKIAPALAAGNTVIIKPSELTPLTLLLFAQLVDEVLPAGVLNIVLGLGSIVGEALAVHQGIDMIALTGSVRSGQAVTRASAESLKRVHLELGGKAPVIVFDDCDLNAVVEMLHTMSFWNTGQECGSACRVLVHRSIYDNLVEKLVSRVQKMVVGNPDDGTHIEMGPLTSEAQRDRVAGYVDRAVAQGAWVALGGQVPDGAGYFYPPTIITDVLQNSEIVQEEVFGPVVTIQVFDEEAEAITLANDVRYGLSASVWTRDGARSLRVSRALDFGTVWVNSHLALATEMPWGGFGLSGHGRDVSTYALDEFTRTKHLMISTAQ